MQCMHINIRKATFIILSFIINHINQIQMADNQMDVIKTKEQTKKNNTLEDDIYAPKIYRDFILHCPSNIECKSLNAPCINCKLNTTCVYGNKITTTCTAKSIIKCKGPKEFEKSLICRFCYQTDPWEHSCELKAHCNSVASPRAYYATNCTVNDDILCLGHRTFSKNVRCNWTGGYRWGTALALSVTLGGFGADRFYLGHWQEGIGKLFSFGGLGVWTLIDVILISLHYLGPADGSLYI